MVWSDFSLDVRNLIFHLFLIVLTDCVFISSDIFSGVPYRLFFTFCRQSESTWKCKKNSEKIRATKLQKCRVATVDVLIIALFHFFFSALHELFICIAQHIPQCLEKVGSVSDYGRYTMDPWNCSMDRYIKQYQEIVHEGCKTTTVYAPVKSGDRSQYKMVNDGENQNTTSAGIAHHRYGKSSLDILLSDVRFRLFSPDIYSLELVSRFKPAAFAELICLEESRLKLLPFGKGLPRLCQAYCKTMFIITCVLGRPAWYGWASVW